MIFKSILFTVTTLLASATFAANKTVVLTKDNTLVMNTTYDGTSVAVLAQKAKDLDGILPSKEPLYLVLDTGGGSIDAGIELIENLNSLNRPVHTITLFSASMGFQTVQGVKGGRYIVENGTLMSHKARGGFSGEFPGQLDSRYSYYLKRVTNLDRKVVTRSKGVHTLQSYAALIENEYWCDGADCIKQGFADAIVSVSCDKSLSGTRVEAEKFVFMGMPVEIQMIMSQCPTITGLIDFKILIGGESLFKAEDTYTYNSKIEKLSKDDLERLNTVVKSIIDGRVDKTKRTILKY